MAPKAQNSAPQKQAGPHKANQSLTPQLSRPEEQGPQAQAMTPKNFRNHPDMENFFRFIFDNDLRVEALEIIDQIIVQRQARRGKKNTPNA